MHLNKTILSTSIAIALGSASFAASAYVTTSSTLNFTLGQAQDIGGGQTDIVGSYFSMDVNNDGVHAPYEKIPMSSFNGIHIGTTQLASGSHSGAIDGTESPNIDQPWEFLGNTGMHQTAFPINVLGGDGGNTLFLDFSGWELIWNGITMGMNQNYGATEMTCDSVSCSDSSNYTIDGAFHITGGGFTTVSYQLHLEDSVSSVPIPAAVWLFGSGLAGLASVARRRRKA